jgi:hypothetical protein
MQEECWTVEHIVGLNISFEWIERKVNWWEKNWMINLRLKIMFGGKSSESHK